MQLKPSTFKVSTFAQLATIGAICLAGNSAFGQAPSTKSPTASTSKAAPTAPAPKPVPTKFADKSSDVKPRQLDNVGIVEHLGKPVPLDLVFTDSQGKQVKLGSYFKSGRPVVLNFVYHTCPTLCSMVTRGMIKSLNRVGKEVGKDFEVISVSIDHRDTPKIAAEKKAEAIGKLKGVSKAQAAQGWHFLTGDFRAIGKLADAAGFGYRFNPKQGEFAHSAAIFVLTPEGKMARYLYGISYAPRDMRLALAEASKGRTVSTVDRILLYCYRYDPNARGYVPVAWNIMRLGGALTLAGLLALIGTLVWREKRQRRAVKSDASALEPTNSSPAPELGA